MPDGSSSPLMTRRTLFNAVWDQPLRGVAQLHGISPNGLAKICDRLLIPYPPRGYWPKARTGRAPARPALAGEADAAVTIGRKRSPSRRKHTRMPADARRDQLLDAAARIVLRDGLQAATTKATAREVGISEAQAHNYFQGADLLIALARREVTAMDEARKSEAESGSDPTARVVLGTLSHLREAAGRGALIRALLGSPAVREALKAERQTRRQRQLDFITTGIHSPAGLDGPTALGLTTILSALCLRTGRLIAEGKLSLPSAERFCLGIVMAGHNEAVRAQAMRRAYGEVSADAEP